MKSCIGVLTVLVASAAFVIAPAAEAGPVIRTGEKIGLSEDQQVAGDFYVGGGTISLSGSVEGDTYVAGRTVVINGRVTQDVVVAAGTAQIHGAVGDDVRVVGGEVVIAEHVGGDVIVLGGTLSVLSTAVVDGDVLFYGGEVDIAGDVNGSFSGHAETIRIDSSIGGNVDAAAASLTLGDRAHVEGNVNKKGSGEIVRAPGSVVVGEVRTIPETAEVSDAAPISPIPFLILLFTTLVYLLLFREQLGGFVLHLVRRPGFNGLIGLGTLFGGPIVALLLISSILGVPLGFALLLAYLLLILVSWSLGGIVTGALLARTFTGKYSLSLLWVIAGTVLFMLAAFVPVLGAVAVLALTLLIAGGIVMLLYHAIR